MKEEIIICENCGSPTPESEIVIPEICEDCYEELDEQISNEEE